MKKFNLKMLTPERTFFSGEADTLTVNAVDGEMQILADHVPVVVGLNPSMVSFSLNGEEKICSVGEGFVTVQPDETVILCQTMEWPHEIELERVNKAIDEHSKLLQQVHNAIDYKISQYTLARANARLKVKEYMKKRGDKNDD